MTRGYAADLDGGVDWLTAPAAVSERWNGWASLGGAWNSETENFGEFVIFAPFSQDEDTLFFGEARGRYFDDDLLAGNAALGLRQMTDSGFNLGVWVGLDVFQSAADNTFGQVSGGVEALSTYFDFRANGYLPFTDPQTAADGTADVILTGPDAFRRGEIYMIGGEEVAAYGADAEAGLRLPFGGNSGHLGVFGGGYWYDADELAESVTGGMARAELAFNDVIGAGSRLTAVYRYTDDNVNGANHMVGGALRFPFGGAPALSSQSQQWQRMIDPLERNPNIYIGRSGREAVEDGYTEVRFDRVAYADTDADLAADIGEGTNTLIVLDGTAPNSEATLLAEQTLAGGGSRLRVQGSDSGAVAYVDMPGTRPAITRSDTATVDYALTLGGFNTVNGVDVVSQIEEVSQSPSNGAIIDVTLGGIDGTGGGASLDVMAIVDTDVMVSMAGTGASLPVGRIGILGGSAVYGINLSGAETAWIESTSVTAIMTGTGGNGGDGGSNPGSGGGGRGILSGTVTGVDLSAASNVRLTDTTVNASMTGTGGDAGDQNNGISTGQGGPGITGGTVTGIDLGNASNVQLTDTIVNVSMTGIGGEGGDENSGRTAGGGNEGISGGTVTGIDLGNASNVQLTDTVVNASMTGTGGDAGDQNNGNTAGQGGPGISGGAVTGIDLSAASDVRLTGATIDISATGVGASSGSPGAISGSGIFNSTFYGINFASANDVWIEGTTVMATMTGTGGTGSDFIGSSGNLVGGYGGGGVNASTLVGIALNGASNAQVSDTSVTANMTGNGGDGGSGTVSSGNLTAIGGAGGVGTSGRLHGVDLSGGTEISLRDTMVLVTMTGDAGTGGTATNNGSGSAIAGGASSGVAGSVVTGINVSGASDVSISGTTGIATLTGEGGDGGGSSGAAFGSGAGGGPGVFDSMLTGIDLSGASNPQLSGTTVTATMNGIGGAGGEGIGSTTGGGGAGGGGVSRGVLAGIDLGSSTSASLTDTSVMAIMNGTGGNGGNGGPASTSGSSGGQGIADGTHYGIELDSATGPSLTGTTVTAGMTGTGGDGGSPGGPGGLGITGTSPFDWINLGPLPPGVLIDPPTFLGGGQVSNNGSNGGP